MIVLGVEPHHATWPGAPGAPGALRAARAAHRLDLQRRQPAPRRVPRDPREAAVDHGDHAVDRHRRLGDVRREDHLALARRAHRRVLLARRAGRRAAAVIDEVVDRDRLGDVLGDAPDLARAGQEHQHVAVELVLREAAHAPTPTCLPSGRSSGCSTCSIVTGNVRPSDRTTGAPPRNAATGSASSVADITTSTSSGRRCAQPLDQARARDRRRGAARGTRR